MDNVAAAAAIGAIVVPLIVSIIKQCGFPRWVNLGIALFVCAGVGTLTAYAAGAFTANNVLGAIAIVAIAAEAAYAAYWRDSAFALGIDKFTTLTRFTTGDDTCSSANGANANVSNE